MNILFYKWGGFNEDLLIHHLEQQNNNVSIIDYPCKDYNSDMELAMQIMSNIHLNSIEAVMTLNYYPIIAVTCNACNVVYYSLVYDSPHRTLYSKSIFYPTNHIGIFDKDLVNELKIQGVSTVYHVPLACDVNYMDKKIAHPIFRNNSVKTPCDISFVGSLYTDYKKMSLYDVYKNSESAGSEHASFWNELEEIINAQCFNYSEDLTSDNPRIDYDYLSQLMLNDNMVLGPDYFISPRRNAILSILERKVTIYERQKLISEIATHSADKYDFKLFTTSDTSSHDEINRVNCGFIDYQAEMPFVFANSKINIHSTLKSIKTGIPLRVMDILSCGGFLLCDPQEEILENFKDDYEIAVYHSLQECIEKIDYYLLHDDKRKEIALRGREKINQLFNYPDMLSKLLIN